MSSWPDVVCPLTLQLRLQRPTQWDASYYPLTGSEPSEGWYTPSEPMSISSEGESTVLRTKSPSEPSSPHRTLWSPSGSSEKMDNHSEPLRTILGVGYPLENHLRGWKPSQNALADRISPQTPLRIWLPLETLWGRFTLWESSDMTDTHSELSWE